MAQVNYQRQLLSYRKYYERHVDGLIKSKQATAYVMVILSLFSISFFGVFAIRPTVKTIVELNRQINDANQVNTALQKKIDDLVTAQEEYQFIKEFVPAIEQALPNQPNLSQVIIKIEDLVNDQEATVAGLSVDTITYKKTDIEDVATTEVSTGATPIDISLQLDGNYSNFSEFLGKLFTMRRTVTADSLELKATEKDQEILLNLLLNLKSFYLKNEQ